MKKSMIQFSYDGLCLQFDKENLRYSILAGKTTWETDEFFSPFFRVQFCDKPIYFKDAEVQKHELVKSGVGEGIRSSYRDFVLSKSAGSESGKEEIIENDHEPLVTQEMFDAVQMRRRAEYKRWKGRESNAKCDGHPGQHP